MKVTKMTKNIEKYLEKFFFRRFFNMSWRNICFPTSNSQRITATIPKELAADFIVVFVLIF